MCHKNSRIQDCSEGFKPYEVNRVFEMRVYVGPLSGGWGVITPIPAFTIVSFFLVCLSTQAPREGGCTEKNGPRAKSQQEKMDHPLLLLLGMLAIFALIFALVSAGVA